MSVDGDQQAPAKTRVSGAKKKVFEPQLGIEYLIKNHAETWSLGTVMTTRTCKNSKNTYEYLVHFKDSDRRLDKWVGSEDIMMEVDDECLGDEVHVGDNATDSQQSSALVCHNVGIRSRAERKRKPPPLSSYPMDSKSATGLAGQQPSSREHLEKEFKDKTKIRYIECIQLGRHLIDCWYFSPYPPPCGRISKIFVCEYCLAYMKSEAGYRYHLYACTYKQPPGICIYNQDDVSVYFVDGFIDKLYCQCLCLLAKLFVDQKTIYFAVDSFDFFVVTERDERGDHIVGYFSRQKNCPENFNLACILVFPPYQGKGFGKFIICLSYELSMIDGITGTPERPLSDLGNLCYKSFWNWSVLDSLRNVPSGYAVSITEVSEVTGMTTNDIVQTLEGLHLLKRGYMNQAVTLSRGVVVAALERVKPPSLIVYTSKLTWPLPL